MAYQIFVDATTDVSESMLSGLSPAVVIPMDVAIGGKSYTYGPGGSLTGSEFYAMQRRGQLASTSQINPAVYRSAFEPYLKAGVDILYLCFSSGMSGTIQAANICMEELREEYPERGIICLDTLCGSGGEGLLLHEALKKQAEGVPFEELCTWVLTNRLHVCHWFTVDTFDYLKHGGRVSTAAAATGTMLQIKPMLHIDVAGQLNVVEKPRGNKKAMAAQLRKMEESWDRTMGNLVVIGHADCPERAEELKKQVKARFPDADIHTADIGPIISAHTGPGMLALVYWGTSR